MERAPSKASISATAVATAGTAPVTVTNPTPGGGTSNSVNFTTTGANNRAPTITTLSPTSVVAGSPAFTLTVNGTNFIASSVINFGNKAETTTFVSATQLTASVAAADVVSAGNGFRHRHESHARRNLNGRLVLYHRARSPWRNAHACKPVRSNVRSDAPSGGAGSINLNGGSATLAWPVHHSGFAVAADLTVVHSGSISPGNYDLTLTTYTGGLRYRRIVGHSLQPYVQILAGGARASGSLVDGTTRRPLTPVWPSRQTLVQAWTSA